MKKILLTILTILLIGGLVAGSVLLTLNWDAVVEVFKPKEKTYVDEDGVIKNYDEDDLKDITQVENYVNIDFTAAPLNFISNAEGVTDLFNSCSSIQGLFEDDYVGYFPTLIQMASDGDNNALYVPAGKGFSDLWSPDYRWNSMRITLRNHYSKAQAADIYFTEENNCYFDFLNETTNDWDSYEMNLLGNKDDISKKPLLTKLTHNFDVVPTSTFGFYTEKGAFIHSIELWTSPGV